MREHGSLFAAPSSRPMSKRLLLAGSTAIALLVAPLGLEWDSMAVAWQIANAKNSGDGGGNAGSHGNGHGGGRDGSKGQANGRPDDAGNGHAYGRYRQDDRIGQAKQRYDQALGHARKDTGGAADDDREIAHRFSPDETRQLIAHGWRARQVADAGFKNHGERVRTMVELAKRLGYGAKVGALQANFGTPYENGIAEIEAKLEAARADLAAGDAQAAARVAELEAELEATVAAAKPGAGPNHDWARADLDVNDDGVVDRRDLEALNRQASDDAS